jgi:hypothetical protein
MTETKRRIKEHGFNDGWCSSEYILRDDHEYASCWALVNPNYKDDAYFEKPPSVFTYDDKTTPKKVSARAALRLLIDRECPPEIMKSYPPFNKTGRSSYSDADVWRILTRVLCYPSPYALKHLLYTFFKTLGFPRALTEKISNKCMSTFEQARAKEWKELDYSFVYQEAVEDRKWVDIVDAWSRGYDYENEKSMNEYKAWKSMQQKERDSQFDTEPSQESKEAEAVFDMLSTVTKLLKNIKNPEKVEEIQYILEQQAECIANGYDGPWWISKEMIKEQ